VSRSFFFFSFSKNLFTEVWTQDLHLEQVYQPFFVIFFFSE
jgi:hypothetical protein